MVWTPTEDLSLKIGISFNILLKDSVHKEEIVNTLFICKYMGWDVNQVDQCESKKRWDLRFSHNILKSFFRVNALSWKTNAKLFDGTKKK